MSLGATALFLAACGGGGDGGAGVVEPPITPAPVAPGILGITVTGLPTGANADLLVTGPASFSRTATGSVAWTDVPPGRYTIAVRPVRAAAGRFAGAPASVTVDVATAAAAAAGVNYIPLPSAFALSIAGLPSGAAPHVTLTAPRAPVVPVLEGGLTVASAQPGPDVSPDQWVLTASSVVHAGTRYTPTPALLDTIVPLGDTARVTVQYAVGSGAIAVAIGGLPAGVSAQATLVAPDNSTQSVAQTSTIMGLTPGRYRLVSRPVTHSGIAYTPSADTLVLDVAASLVATPATVTYAAQVGRLAVTVAGVPSGATPVVTVTGPGGSRQVNSTITLDSLPVGNYTVSAADVVASGERYTATPVSQAATVTLGGQATATVTYALAPTIVRVDVTGLPTGTAAGITLTAPSGSTSPVTTSTVINPAASGRWRLAALPVTTGGATYQPAPAAYDQTVAAGGQLSMPVHYTLATGSIAIVVAGLPGGNSGSVLVSGPAGYSQPVSATTTLTGLAPGAYTVTAAAVVIGGNTWNPSPSSVNVTVTASLTAVPATVTYGLGTGALALTVNGVPGGSSANITITGPSGFSQLVTGSTTLTSLVPGSYTIAAANITAGATTYAPSAASQGVNVVASPTPATASVTYAAVGGGGVNYTISHAYLTQAIQKPDGSVALVANRDALLRVFVLANGANTAQPQVRVRIYDGGTVLQTTTINAPEASVRQTAAEGTLSSSWNLVVPAANVRPTMRVLVDLDPNALVADADRADNSWPLNGTPRSITVNTAPTFSVRFVPVVVGALTGNVSAGNKESYLATTRRIWPLQNVVSDVRAPFTSSATELESGDANGQWLTVLSEINTLRATDGAPSTMHYYGVVKVSYFSGVAGYGYLPGRAAIGWDHLPSGDGVAAHEWGHNFSRNHAPCGVSGDPSYPYAGGVINFWGWNSTTNALVSPTATDVMSYCSNTWVSDYNWTAVMNYRATSGLEASALQAGGTGKHDGLLVWGRVVNGQIQLEPAFRVSAPLTAPAVRATHRLELLDDAGTTLLQLPIEASAVDHAASRDERQFAVVVPWSAAVADRLEELRLVDVRAPLRSVSRRAQLRSPAALRTANAPAAGGVDPNDAVSTLAGGRTRVSWQNGTYRMAMVQDAASGEILGYVRQPGTTVYSGGRRVQVVFSDGVRSAVKAYR